MSQVHLFDIDIPGKIRFKESDVLTAGDCITTFECYGVKIGLGICYDLRFFEMAQLMAKEGKIVCITMLFDAQLTWQIKVLKKPPLPKAFKSWIGSINSVTIWSLSDTAFEFELLTFCNMIENQLMSLKRQ